MPFTILSVLFMQDSFTATNICPATVSCMDIRILVAILARQISRLTTGPHAVLIKAMLGRCIRFNTKVIDLPLGHSTSHIAR